MQYHSIGQLRYMYTIDRQLLEYHENLIKEFLDYQAEHNPKKHLKYIKNEIAYPAKLRQTRKIISDIKWACSYMEKLIQQRENNLKVLGEYFKSTHNGEIFFSNWGYHTALTYIKGMLVVMLQDKGYPSYYVSISNIPKLNGYSANLPCNSKIEKEIRSLIDSAMVKYNKLFTAVSTLKRRFAHTYWNPEHPRGKRHINKMFEECCV